MNRVEYITIAVEKNEKQETFTFNKSLQVTRLIQRMFLKEIRCQFSKLHCPEPSLINTLK
jgi:hypothetical protein